MPRGHSPAIRHLADSAYFTGITALTTALCQQLIASRPQAQTATATT